MQRQYITTPTMMRKSGYIRQGRILANREICSSYQNEIIEKIRNTRLYNAPDNLTIGDKIKNCLVYVKKKLLNLKIASMVEV